MASDLTKVTLDIKDKQVDRLLALALEHDLTIAGMLYAILDEYLGNPSTKPIRKARFKRPAEHKPLQAKKPKPRRKRWSDEEQ